LRVPSELGRDVDAIDKDPGAGQPRRVYVQVAGVIDANVWGRTLAGDEVSDETGAEHDASGGA